MSVQSIVRSVLLALQLCLGFWQIGKLTPVGGLIECGTSYLLWLLGLPSTYTRLEYLDGRMYKAVCCHVTIVADQPTVPRRHRDKISQIESSYLQREFRLKRRNGNKLFLDGEMSYYITDTIWYSLLDMGQVAPETVFLKGYKEFWQQVATGGVMSLTEVLDCLILENHTIRKLDNDLLLPVNLSVSKEKLLNVLNLVGLFLQTKKVYWLIPTLLSFTAAMLEFNTLLRVWLYSKVNLIVCWVAHLICDPLPQSMRRQVYSLGIWVENLKPCNDVQIRVVRGNIVAVIGGGAKARKEGATLVEAEPECLGPGETSKTFRCENIDPGYLPIDIESTFYPDKNKCHMKVNTVDLADVDCNRDKFIKLLTFLSCVARNRSGSLKSCGANKRVRVRGFRESVICYAKNEFPPIYELGLENVVVK